MSAQSEEGGSGIHQGKMWKPHFHLLSRDRLLALRARSPRISVIRILFASVFPLLHCWLPNLDFSGSYAKDYYFCEPCCICVYKTRYVPMKGSIRKSIVALLQRSFAVYRYVFAFIFPCFAVGHCLEMDVSISLVVIVIIALILRLLYSSSRFFVDCPLFSFFFSPMFLPYPRKVKLASYLA